MPNGSSKLAFTVHFVREDSDLHEKHCDSYMSLVKMHMFSLPCKSTCSKKWLFLIGELQWLAWVVRVK
jgi:hypothetical protein